MKKIMYAYSLCLFIASAVSGMEKDDSLTPQVQALSVPVAVESLPAEVKASFLSFAAAHAELPKVMRNLQMLKWVCKEWNMLCRDKSSVIKPALAGATDLEGLNRPAFEQLKICCENLLAALPNLSPERRTIFMVIMKNRNLTLSQKIEMLTPLVLHLGLADFELVAAFYFTDPSFEAFDEFFEVPRRTAFEKNLAESIPKFKRYSRDNPTSDIQFPDQDAPLLLLDFIKEEEKQNSLDQTDLERLMHIYFYNPEACKKWVIHNENILTPQSLALIKAIKSNSVQLIQNALIKGRFVAFEVLWAILVFGRPQQIYECIDFITSQTGRNNFLGFNGVDDGHLVDLDCVSVTMEILYIVRVSPRLRECSQILWDLIKRSGRSDGHLYFMRSRIAYLDDPFTIGWLDYILDTKEQRNDFFALRQAQSRWYERPFGYVLSTRLFKSSPTQENSEKSGELSESEIVLLYIAARLGSKELFEKYLQTDMRLVPAAHLGYMLWMADFYDNRDIVEYLSAINLLSVEKI